MPNTIPLQDWLQVLDREYLSSFIRNGGSSIKFVVTPDGLKSDLYASVNERCRELDYQFVALDAAKIRVHMPQDIFFGLAAQVDWRLLARRQLLNLAETKGYKVDGIDPARDFLDAIGKANWLESEYVFRDIRPEIQRNVSKNPRLAKDFREAMKHLCEGEHTRYGEEYTAQPILDWLTGANTRVRNVRPFSIYTPINRTTARYFIESALYWIRYVGYSGTVILLDNSRVTLTRRTNDGQRFYYKAQTRDHYELLREFIDAADMLPGMLLTVVTNQEFLDEGASSRGYAIYQALQTRVMDDVRDRNRINPVASLVRLSEGAPQNDGST